MLRFTAAEFARIVEAGTSALRTRGFAVHLESELAVHLRSTRLQFSLYQDRGGEIYAKLARPENEDDSFSLQELAAFLGLPETLPSTAPDLDSAISLVSSLAAVLDSETLDRFEGGQAAWTEFCDWVRITRGLETQRTTREKRDPSRWALIIDAWKARRYPSLIRLLELLPKPLTAAESRARAYAQRELGTAG